MLITLSLDSTAPFPSVSKPLMISTVLNDAGPAIYNSFPSPLSESDFQPICNASLGPTRTSGIIGSNFYGPIVLSDEAVDARDQLQPLGTDQLWKCASWTFARNWVRHGGTAYVGLYTVGATYPSNAQIPFCEQTGSVCHQDDIMIVVGFCSLPSISPLAKPDYIYSSSVLSQIQLQRSPPSYQRCSNDIKHLFKAGTRMYTALQLGRPCAVPVLLRTTWVVRKAFRLVHANLLSGEREYLMIIKFMGSRLYFVSASRLVRVFSLSLCFVVCHFIIAY